MRTMEYDVRIEGSQLGSGGVDNLVTNAERICTYEQRRIELTNQAVLASLEGQYHVLSAEMRHLEDKLRLAPPAGDARRLLRRAIYGWLVTAMLTVSGFVFTLLTFAPFRLGWKGWLYSLGIAVVTPFLVEYALDGRNMEKIVQSLTVVAAIAGLASLMLLAVIRGNLLAEEFHKEAMQSVVIDDAVPQPPPVNTFYDKTLNLLRIAQLLMAFTMEVGAGLALRQAWRSVPDSSEDWKALRNDLVDTQQGMIEIVRQSISLRNEPEAFANRYWRDFYSSLLSNAARSAMTKLLVVILTVSACAAHAATTPEKVNLVVAIDLTQSVAVLGPDGKSEFQKNIDGVTRLLSEAPASSRITVIGITARSFAQPYILLSARIPADSGYFGERLIAARSQVVAAWNHRALHLDHAFAQTDILGALQLAAELFAQSSSAQEKRLVIFSDMRQATSELNLEYPKAIFRVKSLVNQCRPFPSLLGVQIFALGVDGAGHSRGYSNLLQEFWYAYFKEIGASPKLYTVLRDISVLPTPPK